MSEAKKHATARILDSIQELIRAGKLAPARTRIRELSRKRPPRPQLVRLAHLAREAFLHDVAVKLLYRTVRDVRGPAPTGEEKAEYALGLVGIGAFGEALELLAQPEVRKIPFAFSALTLSYFRQWDWESALPFIEKRLARGGLSETQRLISRYDRAIVLLHGRDDYARAESELKSLLVDARKHGHVHLVRDFTMMLAQCHVLQKNWGKALALADTLTEFESSAPEADLALALRVLRSEIALGTATDKASALREQRRVRTYCFLQGKFERARGSDFGAALATGDAALWHHLYYGTPYPAARTRFLRLMRKAGVELSESYSWKLAGPEGGARKRLRLDLESGTDDRLRVSLKPGQIPHRALLALATDFYRPPSAIALHERLYGGQFFNPDTSPLRVHQALRQTRAWLEENDVPLEIEERKGRYRLRSLANTEVTLVLPRPRDEAGAPADPEFHSLVARASAAFGEREFTSRELAELVGLSERSALRKLKAPLEQGFVERAGNTTSRRYRIARRTPR